MKSTGKLRVAVLYGGRSAEHEVSLQSAKNVIQYLDSERFDVLPIGICKQGHWYEGKDVYHHGLSEGVLTPYPEGRSSWFSPEWLKQALPSVNQDKPNMPYFDVIFPAVHGTFVEDGCLQGLLEMADTPYVGGGVLSSAVGMDKEISKRLAVEAGIPVAPFLTLRKADWRSSQQECLKRIKETLTYPLFVKPANTGSSIGITKVKQTAELTDAIDEAFRFDRKIVIENGIDALELELAVLESVHDEEEPKVSICGEVRSSREFYCYDAKYIDEQGAELMIPASVSQQDQEKAREMAKKVFMALGCESMARVDLFYDKKTKQIYFNEVNTLPGFTKISMYPKLMEASGLSYQDLLTHLIELAIVRHGEKASLQRSLSSQPVT